MKKITKILLSIVIVLFLIIGGFVLYFFINIRPVSNIDQTISIHISEGQYSRNIIAMLYENGVIKNEDAAFIYAKVFNKTDFKAGDFEVSPSWSLNKLFAHLSDSSNIVNTTVNFTIIPGSNIRTIALNLQDCTNLNANEIINKWNDTNYIESLINDYPFITKDLLDTHVVMKLEGYLFPDTYNIFKETTVEDVTKVILDNTLLYYEKYKDLFDKSDLSINEIFTLASIIDYEGNTLEDRKKISSVFYNRLDISMPLQSSATRCYALSLNENRNITDWAECEVILDFYSPYDTYSNYGLPPGPIRCVSDTSLKAALEPDDTDYLFFIGDVCGDGTVYFSENYAQHETYIQEYLTKCH